LRLDPGLRFSIYATFCALTLTGTAWLAADQLKDTESGEPWQAVAADMLVLHGGTAMIALVLLGALLPVHLTRSWRTGRNRITGAAMTGTNLVLIVTAFGLYYAGSDVVRTWVADIHIAVGFGLPALLVGHIVLGRRRVGLRPSSRDVAGAFLPAIFSEDP